MGDFCDSLTSQLSYKRFCKHVIVIFDPSIDKDIDTGCGGEYNWL